MDAVAIVLGLALLSALAASVWLWRGWQATRAEAARQVEAVQALEGRVDGLEDELRTTRAALDSETSERERLETALTEAEGRQGRLENELDEQRRSHDEALSEERRLRAKLEHARNLERTWMRELRSQVAELQAKTGALGHTGDVRALVLRVAMNLVGAQKGLLLSREDENDDGKLDLVVAEGFEHDPADSAVAQRFAEEVLERDQTVRENDQPDIDRESRTAADEEIENLVAIPIYIRDRFNGVVVCANKPDGFDEHEDEVLLALGDHASAILENGRLHGRLRSAYLATIRMLTEAIEAKDPFLRGRSDQVSPYVAAVADSLEFDGKRREELLFAWLLHDIGKIGISERILHKPGPLTSEEESIVALHPRIGYRLVEQVPDLSPLALHILHHHEHFDGSGYPGGLKGEQIPLEARVIGVADVYGELTADREGGMTPDDACAVLESRAGTEFDPAVVRMFVDAVRNRSQNGQDPHALAAALADPEVGMRRAGPEPVIGTGFEVTDSLTLLYSHRQLHEDANAEAERAAIQGSPFALILFAVTEIDAINRAEGHAAGDEAIRTAARALQREAARRGGSAYRYSGARLALILPGADDADGRRIASSLAAELYDEPSVRCGVGTWRPADSGRDVIDRARSELTGEKVGLEPLLGGETD